MKEIWKDIPGYEKIYQASNLGRIRSLDRYVEHNVVKRLFIKGRVLKQSDDGRGYLSCCFHSGSIQKTERVHQLMAITFLNHQKQGKRLVVDHINNIQFDNRLENLQIITNRENLSKDKKGYKSKYVGVTFHNERWRSRIHIDGKSKHLGYFNTEFDAHLAYQNALKSLNT